jgi:hypothetical protein
MIATAAVIGAVSFWEELCHSADWASDEAQMRTICVSTGHFHGDLPQRLPWADFVAKVGQGQCEVHCIVCRIDFQTCQRLRRESQSSQ